MALFSKMHPGTAQASCQKLVHPFTDSCFMATLDMAVAASYGSAKFFAIIYMLNFMLKASHGKSSARNFLSTKTLKAYIQSVTYGSAAGTIFMTSNCFYRWIYGGYADYNCCYLPAFTAGVAILIDTPVRRPLVITSYANMALDSLLRRLDETGDLKWSKTGLTLAFMLTNAALMYLLKFGGANEQSVWFYTPEKEPKAEASDKERILKLRNLFLRYFFTGLAVSAARLIFSDLALLKSPFRFLSMLLSINNLTLGAFLGSYVTVYQVAEYILSNNDFNLGVAERTALAGLLAGATFPLQPSRTILTSAMVNVFQMVLQILQNQGRIPRLPYQEILFCFYNGFLYHMRAMNPTAVPRTFIRIMSLVTNKRSDYIYSYYAKIKKGL